MSKDVVIGGIVAAVICCFPLIYQVFGTENSCGKTIWDKIKSYLKKK